MLSSVHRSEAPRGESDGTPAPISIDAPKTATFLPVVSRLQDLSTIQTDDSKFDRRSELTFQLAAAAEAQGVEVLSFSGLSTHPVLFSRSSGYCAIVVITGHVLHEPETGLWRGTSAVFDTSTIAEDARQILQENVGPDTEVEALVWIVDLSAGEEPEEGVCCEAVPADLIRHACGRGRPTIASHEASAVVDPAIARRCLEHIAAGEIAREGYDGLDLEDAAETHLPDPSGATELPDSLPSLLAERWDALQGRYPELLEGAETLDAEQKGAILEVLADLDGVEGTTGGICLSQRLPRPGALWGLVDWFAKRFGVTTLSTHPMFAVADDLPGLLACLTSETLTDLLDVLPRKAAPWEGPEGFWLFTLACYRHAPAMTALSARLHESAPQAFTPVLAARAERLASYWEAFAAETLAGSSGTANADDLDDVWRLSMSRQRAAPVERLVASPRKPEPAGPVKVVLSHIGDPESVDGKSAKRRFGSILEPLPLRGDPDPDRIWATLQAEFPWMKEANRALAEAAAIAQHARRDHFRIRPMLIVGPAGAGKSRWARRAAQVACLPFSSASLAGAVSSVLITGIERGWNSGRPGHGVVAMQATRCANPLVLIDEIDKAGSDRHNGHPLDAMLPLLEAETAVRHFDAYLLAPVDHSSISWIMTANTISGLPNEIVSRARVVHVERPGARDFDALVNPVVEDVCRELEIDRTSLPDLDDCLELARSAFESDRDIRKFKAGVEQRITEIIWQPNGLRLVEA